MAVLACLTRTQVVDTALEAVKTHVFAYLLTDDRESLLHDGCITHGALHSLWS
jgi:hypothetical protein